MSILITGGAGYIGSHTTVELLNAGFDVVLAVTTFQIVRQRYLNVWKRLRVKSFHFIKVPF